MTLEVASFRPPWLIGLVIGIILLGSAALLNSVDDWRDSRQAQSTINELEETVQESQRELDCRSDLSGRIGNLESERAGVLAHGLVAVVEEDEVELQRLIGVLDDIEIRLQEARADREAASQTCSG